MLPVLAFMFGVMAAELSLYGQKKDKKHLRNFCEYVMIILFFVGGAAAGAVLTGRFGGNGLIFAIILLGLVLILLCIIIDFVS